MLGCFSLNRLVFAFLLVVLGTDDNIPTEKGTLIIQQYPFLCFEWRVPQTNPGVIPSNLSDSGNS
jgi:hypothetical protein